MAPNLRFVALALALAFPAVPRPTAVAASPVHLENGQQQVIGVEPSTGSGNTAAGIEGHGSSQRKLHGKFLHITDFHPDEFYKAHTSTASGTACHRGNGPSGYYGAEATDCDSPMSLINATFDWISANLADEIDFVVWTGDTARHDSDENIPRKQDRVLGTNRLVADKFFDTFADPDNKHGMAIPVVPNLGNNDILPHNILVPGPTKWLHYYADIWRHFVPEAQRHSFEFGGWFNVEVVPNRLAVFSLNTLYFFDRNAAVDGCLNPADPGFKQMEWLRAQLQLLRDRGMKAILIGHVPPARTDSKQNWDETCWQKYNLWMRQYRDVVVTSLYGHMNIDHFIAHDTHDIDLASLGAESEAEEEAEALDGFGGRDTLEDEFSVESATDYLKELRNGWSKLPNPTLKASAEDEEDAEEEDFDHYLMKLGDGEGEERDEEVEGDDAEAQKKGKKKKGKKGKKIGKFAERYHVSLISPSIVPNYFPTLRVYEYNISGVEDSAVWTDSFDPEKHVNSAMSEDIEDVEEDGEPKREELKRDVEFDTEGKKGKKKKKPKDPKLVVPKPPSKSSPPGPAYSPQPLTLLGYTQYYANLTYLNNDMTRDVSTDVVDDKNNDNEASSQRWRDGIHKDKTPKSKKPEPKPFEFTVEYSTFTDKIYKLSDLTVRSYVKLAYRIGRQKVKGKLWLEGDGEEGEIEGDLFDDDEKVEESDSESSDLNLFSSESDSEIKENAAGVEGFEDEEEDGEEEGDEGEAQSDGDAETEGNKSKKHKKNNKVWMHFLNHAFVETVPKKKLKRY